MLTIRSCKDYGHALGEYLRQADYYSEGLRVEGVCFGRLSDQVGLEAGAIITDEAFAVLAQNHHAETGKQLTERMAAERRAGYDAVFSAPKSVSIQAFVGGDERLIAAHDRAVQATLAELERHACRQAGQGINKQYIRSGSIAAAVFRHGESRALDPQLHSHAFVFNATWDAQGGRLVALETSEIFARARYLTEVYRNTLSAEVRQLGYEIERTAHGFELAGVSPALIERFSKRSNERDAAIAAREIEVGRSLSADEIAVLVRENRQRKLHELSPEEVRARQLSQVSETELASLHQLRRAKPTERLTIPLGQAIEHAKEHVFERQAVVPDHGLMAEIIRAGYGNHTLADVQASVAHGQHGLLVVDGQVSTQESLDHERALVAEINRGLGSCPSLGHMPASPGLNGEQRQAVQHLLDSCDAVMVLRGKAGAGKTQSLATVIEGCSSAGCEVACFAPSTKAVEILQRDGVQQRNRSCPAASGALSSANTVQRLLVDPAMQASAKGKLLVIDEYGLLSSRDLKRLVDLAQANGCRLLLVGDAAQHTSVEASAAARLIERESRVTVAEIKVVRRQQANRDYLRATKALASGHLYEGLAQLDAMGAVIEIHDPAERRARMVEEWNAVTHGPGARRASSKTALMVAPTWAEIEEINQAARQKLRGDGTLRGEDKSITALATKNFTRAEKKQVENYRPGDVLVAHKRTKYFDKGEELLILSRDRERVMVRNTHGKEYAVSPRQTGLAWTVCEQRPLAVAAGDKLRLRSVGQVRLADGSSRRIANGTTVTVSGVDAAGRVRLPDGAVLLSREVVHGYALTSHAAQGMTVDAVFMTDPISREGLYVSATRGRESIRIFTPDRDALLDASRLVSEERITATEFARKLQLGDTPPHRSRVTATVHELRSFWETGLERGRDFALTCRHHLRPSWLTQQAASLERSAPRQTGTNHPEAN